VCVWGSPEIRGGLTDVAKVLQNLFNLLLFTDPEKSYMFCVNQYIEASKKKVESYLDKVVDVKDPEEFLEVDQYMELVQRAKPVIVISTHEVLSFSRGWGRGGAGRGGWESEWRGYDDGHWLTVALFRLCASTPWWRST
jgi:hypothetical protein